MSRGIVHIAAAGMQSSHSIHQQTRLSIESAFERRREGVLSGATQNAYLHRTKELRNEFSVMILGEGQAKNFQYGGDQLSVIREEVIVAWKVVSS